MAQVVDGRKALGVDYHGRQEKTTWRLGNSNRHGEAMELMEKCVE